MRRFTNRAISFSLIALFCTLAVQAYENTYQNSLQKVELVKATDGTYNVNLYTQKKYSAPVKVVKKSDLNYYILLPETSNSVAKLPVVGPDIRTIDTKTYAYPEVAENGYTKININTSKPLNFNVSVKNGGQSKTAQAAASVELKPEIALNTSNTTEKTQKKNSVSSKSVSEKSQKTEVKKQNKAETKKEIKKAKTNVSKVAKPATTQKKVVKELPQPRIEQIELETKPLEIIEPIEETVKDEEVASADMLTSASEEVKPANEEEIKQIESIAGVSQEKDTNFIDKVLGFFKNFDQTIEKSNINIAQLIFGLLCGIFGLVLVLVLAKCISPKNSSAKIKRRVDLLNSMDTIEGFVPKEEENQVVEGNGETFMFDNNVKLTAFCDPLTTTKRNYELSSYEPDLKKNYKRNKVEKDSENEYDIIQRILKEDSLIEVSDGEFEVMQNANSQIPTLPSAEAPKAAQAKATETAVKEEENEQPIVLSNVEIAPERGFMCVSYKDNINLMGYIFDDVFSLYNFKVPKLENYEIKYRLSEKDDRGASFIVKTGNTKMLIKVTKNSMKLEVAM